MAANSKHDYDPIKEDYVEGVLTDDNKITWPTLEDLAKKYDISISTLRKTSAKYAWTRQKNAFRADLERKRQETKQDLIAEAAAQFDRKIFKVAETGLRHIQGHFLVAQEQFIKSEGRNPMPLSRLTKLAIALEKYQKIGRLALGEATDLAGGTDRYESFQLIREIISTPEYAERIRANFRLRLREGSGQA